MKKATSDKPFSGGWILLTLVLVSVSLFISVRGIKSSARANRRPTSSVTFEEAIAKWPSLSPSPMRTVVRHRLEPEATKRLIDTPQLIKSVLTISGRAENADWGLKGMTSFLLTYTVACKAEIIGREETAAGDLKVVEKRTYTLARQDLQLSEVDVALALQETLPLKAISGLVNATSLILASCGAEASAGSLCVGGQILNKMVKLYDGKSIRGVLGMVGVDLTPQAEAQINEFVKKYSKDVFRQLAIEGKSYLIVYRQEKITGAPLGVEITYADGRPLETEEEWLVLRRANAFIDSKVVPDKKCSPGDTWTIDTADFECLMDPFVAGSYRGEVKIVRLRDDDSGNWILSLKPAYVAVVSDQGRGSGELQLLSGQAEVDGRHAFIKTLSVMGKGSLKNLTSHHLLFQSRLGGSCEFRGTLITEPLTE